MWLSVMGELASARGGLVRSQMGYGSFCRNRTCVSNGGWQPAGLSIVP